MKYKAHTNDEGVLEVDLLPCPFCGGEPKMEFVGNSRTKTRKVTISCRSCRFERVDAAIINSAAWLVEVSSKAWNKRIKIETAIHEVKPSGNAEFNEQCDPEALRFVPDTNCPWDEILTEGEDAV